jgi:hypothetical protein
MLETAPRQTASADAPVQPVGNLRLLAWLEALILTLLLALPGQTLDIAGAARARRLLLRRTASLAAAFAPDAPGHAAAVALGLIPDWILPAHPRKGLRRHAIRRPYARIPASARAPPGHQPVPSPEITSGSRARRRALYRSDYESNLIRLRSGAPDFSIA